MSDSSGSNTPDKTTLMDVAPTWPYDLAVLGTGDFGRALAAHAVRRGGLRVALGSRDPAAARRPRFVLDAKVEVVETTEAARSAPVVVVALPRDVYSSLDPKSFSPDQVIVDCSNRYTAVSKDGLRSQAHALRDALNGNANVVKAFNVLSAYNLEKGPETAENTQVPMAGDNPHAKSAVSALILRLGFSPLDMGSLDGAAASIEDIPHRRFDNWRSPLLFSFIWYIVLYAVISLRYGLTADKTTGECGMAAERMYADFFKVAHKTSNAHASWLLCLCYLPGCIAGYIQLFRGTKYSRFPTWLDLWLKSRKELGLLMLLSATYHGIAYMLMYQAGSEHGGTYAVQTMLSCGIGAYVFTVILGITSLPSVGRSMSWQEFRIVQSNLGWLVVILSAAHIMAKGWNRWWQLQCGIPNETCIAVMPLLLVLALKIPLVVFGRRLDAIRSGRDSNGCC